ncbi:radical SAM family protein [Alphaproteobacteria bacterium]|nr:radical SAM family protein [Alphaproteobacteria bacterium]
MSETPLSLDRADIGAGCSVRAMRLSAYPSSPQLAALDGRHPCFSENEGAGGRLHLPVSPGCNIACRFCKREISQTVRRPGVTRKLLSPSEALSVVGRALDLCKELAVAGIAGPGDTLASPYALETFRLIHRSYPHLINCLSTNGLLLPEKAVEIITVGVKTITVTINAVDPAIGARMNAGVSWKGRWLSGEKAAVRLIANQLEGVRKIADLGGVVKINTVLAPEINGGHIRDIAKAARKAGATIINIIPLIPQHQMIAVRPPSAAETSHAQAEAENYLAVFRHCQRCRADACGAPGKSDFSAALYGEETPPLDATFSHG